MIKAVFLDFDGTTYSHKTNMVPDSAYKAILSAQANGIKVFLSTGRDMEELKTFNCRELKFDGFVLASGQLLMDKEHKIIYSNFINGEEKEKIIDLYNGGELPVMIRSLNLDFMNYVDDDTMETFKDIDTKHPEFKKYNNEDILMATIFTKNTQKKQMIIDMFPNLNVTWWHDDSADLISKGNNKAIGITRILKHYNISLDDTLVVGDGENDIEMLKLCKNSVAMGNSINKVKELVTYITSDIDEDGLYNAFKKYNII